MLIAILALGPVFRALGAWYLLRPGASQLFDPHVALDVLTSSQLDAFAAGALVALFPVGRAAPRSTALGGLLWLALGALFVTREHLPLLSLGYPIGMASGGRYLWGYSLINGCSALLIDCLTQRRVFPRLFEARPLAYLGRISYGLYVIHYPMQAVVDHVLPHARVSLRIGVQAALTVLLASLSYHLWEAPFLRFKDRWFRSLARVPLRPAA